MVEKKKLLYLSPTKSAFIYLDKSWNWKASKRKHMSYTNKHKDRSIDEHVKLHMEDHSNVHKYTNQFNKRLYRIIVAIFKSLR